MTGQDDDHHRSVRPIDLAGQRQRLATVAANIAHTEELVAETLERLALMRPYDAGALRARAAQARRQAEAGRDRAATFSHPREPRGARARSGR